MSSQTAFRGVPVNLEGDIPTVGSQAPDFSFVTKDLTINRLYQFTNQTKVIIAFPSIDTGVCATETLKFNKKLASLPNVVGITISKDLPFALSRFCGSKNIKDLEVGSDLHNDFASKYGVLITDGPLRGLLARIIFVVGSDNSINYVEIVPDIVEEPNYDAVLNVVES